MEIITLTCKVISPMFIGNANGKNAELRPSTFEGSLRFWWRAIHPDLSEYELRKQETEFFGGSYMDRDDYNKTVNKPPSYRFLEITGGEITSDKIDLDPRDGKNRGKAKAIMPNSVFTIKLQIINNNNNKEKVLALFKLASALGGLGKRSRRGAGAWKIEKINGENNIVYNKENIDKWITTINSNYPTNNQTQNFPYLKKYTIGSTTYTNQRELRIRIMVTASQIKDNYKKVKKENGRCKNNRGRLVYYHPVFNKNLGSASKRLSSPVYVSILAKENNEIVPIISFLGSNEHKIKDEFSNSILNNVLCIAKREYKDDCPNLK